MEMLEGIQIFIWAGMDLGENFPWENVMVKIFGGQGRH